MMIFKVKARSSAADVAALPDGPVTSSAAADMDNRALEEVGGTRGEKAEVAGREQRRRVVAVANLISVIIYGNLNNKCG